MENEELKEEIKKLMKIKGECRGVHLKNDADFVLRKKGKEGLRKLEEELEKIGCPIKYEQIKPLGFYPVGWRAISLLMIKKLFGWQDKEIKELCGFASGISLIVRIYMKFFHSVEKAVEKAPQMWREYFTEGKLVVVDYSEEKRYAILEIRNFDLHQVYCRCLEGYLEMIIKMIVKAKKVECKEIECTFLGGKCHRFKANW
jgi:hypothetical protein